MTIVGWRKLDTTFIAWLLCPLYQIVEADLGKLLGCVREVNLVISANHCLLDYDL